MPAKRKTGSKSPARPQQNETSVQDTPVPVEGSVLSMPAEDASQDIIRFKEVFTTPSMIFDNASKRIVPHPQYNVAVVQQLARVQGTLLSVLRQAEANQGALTPKQLLFELERGLLYVFAATSAAQKDKPLSYVLSDAEAAQHLPVLEASLARRDAEAKAIAAAAYVVSHGASATALGNYLAMLQQRIEAELAPGVQQRRPPGAQAALNATRNNLTDVAEQIRALQIHFQSISTASQVSRQMPSETPDQLSAEANTTAASSVTGEYYNMLRWLLAVEQDRHTLAPPVDAGAQLPQPAKATPGAALDAVVREYDPFEGKIVLERPTPTSKWGLMLNQNGYLVGVENKLRNASDEGGRLYQTLRQQNERRAQTATVASGEGPAAVVDGLAILEVNRKQIRPVNLSSEDVAARQDDILAKLREALSKDVLTLHLRVEKRPQAELAAPREVLFDVCQQGGEHSIGQRVVLVLQRPSAQVRWGLDVEFGETASDVLLRDFHNTLQLSEAAKNFLFDHRGHLGVMQVNYKNVADLPDGKQGFAKLMSSSLVIALQLQVLAGESGNAQALPTARKFAPTPVIAPEDEVDVVLEDEEGGEEVADAAPEEEEVEELGEAAKALEDAEDDEALELPTQPDDEFARVSEAIADEYLADEEPSVPLGEETEPAELEEAEQLEDHEEVPEEALEEDVLEAGAADQLETEPQPEDAATRMPVDADAEHRELLEEYGIDADAPLRDEEQAAQSHAMQDDGGDGLTDMMEMVAAQLDTPVTRTASVTAKSKTKRAVKPPTPELDVADEEVLAAEEEETKPKRTRQTKSKAEKKKKKAKRGKKASAKKSKKAKASSTEELEEEEDIVGGEDDAVEDAVEDADAEEAAADPLDAVRDTPLVENTKDRADIAIEQAEKTTRRRKAAAADPVPETQDALPDAPRVSFNTLMAAKPLPLNNSVRIDRFDGSELELHRSDVQDNWDISVAYDGSDLVLSGISALTQAKLQKHPFAQALRVSPEGRVNWTIESINGKDMFGLDKKAKMNVLKTLKNPITTLRLVLKR